MQWHFNQNNRIMPWKGEPDPYKIWLSEIILQQTRVEQGLNYYLRFVEAYPTVFALAGAQDEDVFKKWEGLGYYSRCRNLLSTARLIVEKYNGQFPGDYQALLQLKGVGPYTAAAIASFGFGLPYAVVDGNVTRVLSRFFLVETPIDTPEGQKIFKAMAQDVLDLIIPGLSTRPLWILGLQFASLLRLIVSIVP
jgi:A/G-specific adenine glycosylase